MSTVDVKELICQTHFMEDMFDHIRLVDPAEKEVLTYKCNMLDSLGIECYDFWQKGECCKNCISLRAFVENKTFVKFEYCDESIYMVTAVPFSHNEHNAVIEFLKDITESIALDSSAGSSRASVEMQELLDKVNTKALRDSLTELYNRRYIDEKLPLDIVNTALSDQPISLIMTDIDVFKAINDEHGHLAGDKVLCAFAGILRRCVQRGSDWVARFGGEEFVICLPGADLERAATIAEKIRKEISEEKIPFKDEMLAFTASFGVASMKPGIDCRADEILHMADKMLYLAKRKGRNRVEC